MEARAGVEPTPTVYDNKMLYLPRSCQLGWIGVGPQTHGLGMAYDPMICDQIKQSHDVNWDARRATCGFMQPDMKRSVCMESMVRHAVELTSQMSKIDIKN